MRHDESRPGQRMIKRFMWYVKKPYSVFDNRLRE